LDENEVYIKYLEGLETDGTYLYYLDRHYALIYKVDITNLKLVKTIGNKGQGPSELNSPAAIAVKNGNIYLWDIGFGGIKIFSTEGKFINEFRLKLASDKTSYFLQITDVSLDVDHSGNIFLPEIDQNNNTTISVYSPEGKKIRSFLAMDDPPKPGSKEWVLKTIFSIKFDPDENVIVLYRKQGTLKKIDKQGKLIWKRDLYTDLPDDQRNPKQKFNVSQTMVSMTYDFTGFCLTETGDIFISTTRGGILYSGKTGKTKFIYKQPDQKGFGRFFCFEKDKLFTSMSMCTIKK